MPIYQLDERLLFPPAQLADEEGVLAVGGDLRPERVMLAYAKGIFPWYHEGLPILWHSPDPRTVLTWDGLRFPRRLMRGLRRLPYDIRLDTAFSAVIDGCATRLRPDQDGTWITPELRAAYLKLHALGFAHSVEAYRGEELVGGLYGVGMGRMFFGESMFALAPDASKLAFAVLLAQLRRWDVALIDCQVTTEHLSRFGAEEWPRSRYLAELAKALGARTKRGRWSFEAPPAELAAEIATFVRSRTEASEPS